MNFFSVLQDEGADPADNVPVPVATKAPAAEPAAAAKPQQRTQTSQQPRNNRGAPRRPNNTGGDRTPAGTDAVESDLSRDVRSERTAGQRGGRGNNRTPRGGRGGRGSGGNRPMDRHSMTDRTDSHKQEHQAWGGDEGKRELSDENAGEQDAQAAVSGVATPIGDGPTTAAAVPAQPEVEAEPEDNTKTYQEWLAEQKKENIGGNLPEARKANEGVDDSQWKDAVALKKEEDDDILFAQTKEGKARKQKEKKEKTFIEFDLPARSSGQSERGRGGRGRGEGRGRGGDRGGRGRGSQRGAPRSNGPRAALPVDTSDASAFPSLS